jgi:ribosomal protein S12
MRELSSNTANSVFTDHDLKAERKKERKLSAHNQIGISKGLQLPETVRITARQPNSALSQARGFNTKKLPLCNHTNTILEPVHETQ